MDDPLLLPEGHSASILLAQSPPQRPRLLGTHVEREAIALAALGDQL